jgi:transposase
LERLVSVGKGAARKLTHARILLAADQSPTGPGCKDTRIAEVLRVSVRTIESLRQRFVEQGMASALEQRKPRGPTRSRLLDGAKEAHLIATCCSAAPKGRKRWTLRLLADRLVELAIVPSISHETVRQTLKKTNSSLGSSKCGAFLPSRTPNSSVRWRTS